MAGRDDPRDEPRRANTHPDRSALLSIAAFGVFRLHLTERVLEKGGAPLKIGSRALDILITLLEHAPEVVSKRDLIARVWGPLVVDEGNLRFNIAALRKVLGEAESGVPYVTNITGRGYCFTAPVTWTARSTATTGTPATPTVATSLPRLPRRVLGRDGAVRDITRWLREHRFVSIVGAGGIGKTTVALTVAHEVLSEFAGAVRFLDVAVIEDPPLLANALASQLGLSMVSENPLPLVLAFLRERRVLLVLDSCEHLIDAAARLAEDITRDSPQTHILATSRESLRAEGEWVHHLSPLECPPSDTVTLTATQALEFPAVQLFVEQVAASGHPFRLNDADAPIVAEICRRLDGIALALELTACRVGVYGVQGTATLLDNQFRLLWRGRRTALPRHQTLSATFDWSHDLLSETERLTLRRLAVFVGPFSLQAALDVVVEDLDAAAVTEALARLVEKSLVTLDATAAMRYRLLDTTRTYAWQKLVESGEQVKIARRHGEHIIDRIELLKARVSTPSNADDVKSFIEILANVRAALEWYFSKQGDARLGVRLAAGCVPLFFQSSLLPECISWAERAIRGLDQVSSGTRLELELQACFGLALTYTRGNAAAGHSAITRALELAGRLKDRATQLLLLYGLYRFDMRSGDFRRLAELANRFESTARDIEDPLAGVLSHAIFAVTNCLAGNYSEVPVHARIALAHPARSSKVNALLFGYLHRIGALDALARSLWMLGYADQASKLADQCLNEAAELGNPATIVYALGWNLFIYLRVGDWHTSQQLIDRLTNHATKYGLSTYHPVAVGWQGTLAILRGELLRGTELLQAALVALEEEHYGLYRGVFSGALADGFAQAGRMELAHARVCEAIAWAETHGASADLPELLRIKAAILTAASRDNLSEAEVCLARSLQLARQQSALSLELRTGMGLARLWADRCQFSKALRLLAPIHGRFSEGFQTPDLVAAANLLHELRSREEVAQSSERAPTGERHQDR